MAKNPKILSIVLAGGEGTRLMPLTRDRAKPAVPFGGVFRLIDFPLSNLVNSGYMQTVVLTQYKSHSLDRHISTVWRFSPLLGNYVSPVPAQQRLGKHWYLGSADAIYQTINIIEDVQPDIVVIVGADHVYRMDFQQMVQQHLSLIHIWLGFGHQHRVTDDGFDIAGYRRGIERRGAHGILQVCHADQIIHIIADDRYTGESGTGAQFQHVLQRLPAFDANHISARHHDLTRQRFGQRQYVAQHFGNLRVEIIRLDQTIYGGAPLFELDFFKLLIVRQIIRMTFRILLSADFSEWRQSHRDRRRIGMLQHQIDRFGGARATWTDQQRNHRDHQREHEADKQSRP